MIDSDPNALQTDPDWTDVFGPRVRFLTGEEGAKANYSVILGVLEPGVAIPLHSHADRETFVILSGIAEGYVNSAWQQVSNGQVMDVPSNSPHAWRNSSSSQATVLIVTTYKMREFFTEIGRPAAQVTAPPSPEELGALFAAAQRYDYWMAPLQDNLAIGLELPV
jgi:quercetin dioxygenase-like cupin family protein